MTILSPCIGLYASFISLDYLNNPRKFYEDYLSKRDKYYTNYSRLWSRKVTLLGGEEAIMWSSCFTNGGVAYTAMSLMILKFGTRFYYVDGSCLSSAFPKWETTFFQILTSLSFLV